VVAAHWMSPEAMARVAARLRDFLDGHVEAVLGEDAGLLGQRERRKAGPSGNADDHLVPCANAGPVKRAVEKVAASAAATILLMFRSSTVRPIDRHFVGRVRRLRRNPPARGGGGLRYANPPLRQPTELHISCQHAVPPIVKRSRLQCWGVSERKYTSTFIPTASVSGSARSINTSITSNVGHVRCPRRVDPAGLDDRCDEGDLAREFAAAETRRRVPAPAARS